MNTQTLEAIAIWLLDGGLNPRVRGSNWTAAWERAYAIKAERESKRF